MKEKRVFHLITGGKFVIVLIALLKRYIICCIWQICGFSSSSASSLEYIQDIYAALLLRVLESWLLN
jgi:hypothetical protein